MLKKINKVKFVLNKNNDLYKEYKSDIEIFWNEFSKTHPDAFNDDVLTVLNIEEESMNYIINLGIAKFSDIVYGKLKGQIKTRTLFSGGYLLTNDDYICFTLDKNDVLNLIGGMASLEDFSDNYNNAYKCLVREFKEEMGLDILKDDFQYVLKYIKCPDVNEENANHYPIGTIYEIITKYSKNDILKIFKSNGHDQEIKELLFFKLEDLEKTNNYNKKDYITDLVELIKQTLM